MFAAEKNRVKHKLREDKKSRRLAEAGKLKDSFKSGEVGDGQTKSAWR